MNAFEQRRALNAAIAAIEALVRAIIAREGVPVTDDQRASVALQVFREVQRARAEALAVANAQLGYPANVRHLAPKYRLGAPMKLIKDVVERQGVTEPARRDPLVAKKTARAITRGLQRHAEQPARELVVDYAESTQDGAWARVLTGATSCYFCAMLASRGPVYTSQHNALTGKGTGVSQRDGKLVYVFHDGCDCIVVFVPNAKRNMHWEGRTAWKRLEAKWKACDEDGDLRADDDDRPTVNVFRSWWESAVRQGDTDRYIPDSISKQAAA